MRKLQGLGRPFGTGQQPFNAWVTRSIDEIVKASAELSKGIDLEAAVAAGLLTQDAADLIYQPLDSDLLAIALLTPSNDDIIQRKAGAWTNRTLAQYAADLSPVTAFAPVFTASSGTLTTVTSDIVYTRVGRLLTMSGEISIVDAGTAGAALLMTLPSAADKPSAGAALEVASTGSGGRVRVDPPILGASLASILKYDNTTLIATGRRIVFSLAYFVP